jgi:hypothetical protein
MNTFESYHEVRRELRKKKEEADFQYNNAREFLATVENAIDNFLSIEKPMGLFYKRACWYSRRMKLVPKPMFFEKTGDTDVVLLRVSHSLGLLMRICNKKHVAYGRLDLSGGKSVQEQVEEYVRYYAEDGSIFHSTDALLATILSDIAHEQEN